MPSLLVATDPTCLAHEPGPHHPESPDRLSSLLAFLTANGVELTTVSTAAELPDLTRVHELAYLRNFLSLRGRQLALDAETIVGPASVDAALAAAGVSMAVADALSRGTVDVGAALVRPPGHHATPAGALGYCFLNNAALMATVLADRFGRVAILDLDAHHGNGTQDIFAERADVLFVSFHQAGLYPESGGVEERGRGPGRGATLNLPLAPGAGDADYAYLLREVVLPALHTFGPGALVLSLGLDAHIDDPMSDLGLTTTGYGAITGAIARVARDLDAYRIAVALEGGYDLASLGAGVLACLTALTGDDVPALTTAPPMAVTLTLTEELRRSLHSVPIPRRNHDR